MELGYALMIESDIAILVSAKEGQILDEIDRRAAIQGYQPGTHQNLSLSVQIIELSVFFLDSQDN
jgi:hypothetical protein